MSRKPYEFDQEIVDEVKGNSDETDAESVEETDAESVEETDAESVDETVEELRSRVKGMKEITDYFSEVLIPENDVLLAKGLPHLLTHFKKENTGRGGKLLGPDWRELDGAVAHEREALQEGYNEVCEVCGWLR